MSDQSSSLASTRILLQNRCSPQSHLAGTLYLPRSHLHQPGCGSTLKMEYRCCMVYRRSQLRYGCLHDNRLQQLGRMRCRDRTARKESPGERGSSQALYQSLGRGDAEADGDSISISESCRTDKIC